MSADQRQSPAEAELPRQGRKKPAAAGADEVDLKRVVRRETTSSRAVPAVIAAIIIGVLAAYGLLEAGVHAVGQPAWLIEPHVAARRIIALPDGVPRSLLAVAGAFTAMIGLFFLLQALLPGRRARHALDTGRAGISARSIAVIVDDEVMASALARRARIAANVTPEQVMVVVSQRQVLVNVRPTSGAPLSEKAILAAVRGELEEMAPVPLPEVRVLVATAGVIGA